MSWQHSWRQLASACMQGRRLSRTRLLPRCEPSASISRPTRYYPSATGTATRRLASADSLQVFPIRRYVKLSVPWGVAWVLFTIMVAVRDIGIPAPIRMFITLATVAGPCKKVAVPTATPASGGRRTSCRQAIVRRRSSWPGRALGPRNCEAPRKRRGEESETEGKYYHRREPERQRREFSKKSSK